jgi:hypothetical protein
MITVLFSRTGHPLSRFIRWATGSFCSHVALLYTEPTMGIDVVLEANEDGFGMLSLEQWRQRNEEVYRIDVPADLGTGLRAVAVELGERYDVEGLVGMAVVMLGRWLRRRWRNPWQSRRAMFCSELVSRVLIAGGWPVEVDPSATSPHDLYVLLGGHRSMSDVTKFAIIVDGKVANVVVGTTEWAAEYSKTSGQTLAEVLPGEYVNLGYVHCASENPRFSAPVAVP